MSKPIEKRMPAPLAATGDYPGLVGGISELVEAARRGSARTVNAFMTATYWEVGRRIVEFEQGGENRAKYGKELLKRLAEDLTARHGRGFSVDNLENMRLFYGVCGSKEIYETLSRELRTALPASSGTSLNSETPSRIFQTASGKSPALPCNLADVARAFPLPWSHYLAA